MDRRCPFSFTILPLGRLEIQPPRVLPPQQPVVRIDLPRVGPIDARLLVRRREHDPPVQFFQRPPVVIHKAQAAPKRVVFPEGENEKILRAGHLLVEEKIAKPILLGNENTIRTNAAEAGVSLEGMEIVDIERSGWREIYARERINVDRLTPQRGASHGG